MGSGFLGFETDAEAHARRQKEAADRFKAAGGVSVAAPTDQHVMAANIGTRDPFNPDGPLIGGDPRGFAEGKIGDANIGIPNFDVYMAMLKRAAGERRDVNPYSITTANQVRPDQVAALELARSRLGGPSLAGANAQMASSANVDAGRQAAFGGQGALAANAAAGQVNNANAGLAGQAGQARLQEYLAQQAMIGQGATGMRGADLSVMQGAADARLANRGLNMGFEQAAAGLGSHLQHASQNAALENYKLYQKLKLQQQGANQNQANAALGTGGAMFGQIESFAKGQK